MFDNRRVIAVITAAGAGTRMGAAVPKQFLKTGGRTIIRRTLDLFEGCGFVDMIVVVVPEDSFVACETALGGPRTTVIKGGSQRQDSVSNGIRFVCESGEPADAVVLIHDGVRPYASPDLIKRVTEAAIRDGGAIAAVPAKDTVRDIKLGTLDRSRLYNVQTPQGFVLKEISEAFAKAQADGFYGTDDASLCERAGYHITIVPGEEANIKITTREDLKMESRIGTGYDVHRLVEGRKLILGGVEIPYELGLLGHSDADVLIHALMDAMLGAAALGDIGKLFPDTADEFEGISSVELLKRVTAAIAAEGYTFGNCDVTVICQRPKLRDYIDEMRRRVADAIGTPIDSVSIKATTTEKLGFTGRGEGIAAEAVCMLLR